MNRSHYGTQQPHGAGIEIPPNFAQVDLQVSRQNRAYVDRVAGKLNFKVDWNRPLENVIVTMSEVVQRSGVSDPTEFLLRHSLQNHTWIFDYDVRFVGSTFDTFSGTSELTPDPSRQSFNPLDYVELSWTRRNRNVTVGTPSSAAFVPGTSLARQAPEGSPRLFEVYERDENLEFTVRVADCVTGGKVILVCHAVALTPTV